MFAVVPGLSLLEGDKINMPNASDLPEPMFDKEGLLFRKQCGIPFRKTRSAEVS